MAEHLVIRDGTRPVGHLVPRGDKLEAFDAAGNYLASFPAKARKEAMSAVSAADKVARAKGDAS